MKTNAMLFALLAALAVPAAAQPVFEEVTPTEGPWFVTPDTDDFWINSIAPADVDGDGDLDLAVMGFYVVYNESVTDTLLLFLNEGEGAGGRWSFNPVEVPLGGVFAGATDLSWADYDGDGDHDLLVASEGTAVLYRNDAGTLVATDTPLPSYWEDSGYEDTYDLRSATWADYDNDGDPDLLLPSVYDEPASAFRTVLVRNDGSDGADGWLFADSAIALEPTTNAQSAWIDDDADGDLDLFVANVDPLMKTGGVKLYDNDVGTFTANDPLGIRIEHGLADIGDPDADGDSDILVAGNIFDTDDTYKTVLRIYRNDGGSYVPETLVQAPDADWLDFNAATWADYDSDGDVDLLLTGSYVGNAEIVGKSEIYGNEGGDFTPLGVQLPAPIGSLGRGGAFTWFDLDGDGDLDYLVAGGFFVPGGNGLVEAQVHLFRNTTPAVNAAPAAPVGLHAELVGDVVTMGWSAAGDDHTPPAQLTYDLELWRDGVPLTLPERLPQPGSIATATSWSIAQLPDGAYTWTVRAVDSAFAGSASASGSFTLPWGSDIVFADGFEAGG